MDNNTKENKVGTIYCNLDSRDIYIKPEEKIYFEGINVVMNICPNCLKLATIEKTIKRTLFNNIKKIEYRCRECGFEQTIK